MRWNVSLHVANLLPERLVPGQVYVVVNDMQPGKAPINRLFKVVSPDVLLRSKHLNGLEPQTALSGTTGPKGLSRPHANRLSAEQWAFFHTLAVQALSDRDKRTMHYQPKK